jgi:gamma-D-glutamyl-L-lysine dipeptidyl-peptidase
MPLIEVNPAPSSAAAQPPQSAAGETPARALVRQVVTDVRRQPDDESPRLSQALLGEAATVLAETAGWAHVRLDRDGCAGWVHAQALHRCGPGEAEAYLQACNALVSTELLSAFLHLVPLRPGGGSWVVGGQVGMGEAGKLPFGVALPLVDQQGLWAAVRLPDGAQWWVSNVLLPLASRPGPDAPGIVFALDLLRRCVGVPFLPGGRTPFGFDDAGLAQALWGFVGVNIPRYAPQQFEAGTPVETEPQPGDLVFFGEAEADGQRPVTHVAISLGGDDLIHANRHTCSVAIHSLNAASSAYHAWLCDHLVGVRRFG